MGEQKGKFHDKVYYYDSYDKILQTIHVKIYTIKQNFDYLNKRYDEVERAHQDLLHYIEFAELSTVEGYKVMKKLKEIRIERRLVKAELEECKIAYDVVDNMVVDQLVKQIQQTIGDCKKTQLDFKKDYKPRNCELTGISKEKFEIAQNKYNKKLKEDVVIFK